MSRVVDKALRDALSCASTSHCVAVVGLAGRFLQALLPLRTRRDYRLSTTERYPGLMAYQAAAVAAPDVMSEHVLKWRFLEVEVAVRVEHLLGVVVVYFGYTGIFGENSR